MPDFNGYNSIVSGAAITLTIADIQRAFNQAYRTHIESYMFGSNEIFGGQGSWYIKPHDKLEYECVDERLP